MEFSRSRALPFSGIMLRRRLPRLPVGSRDRGRRLDVDPEAVEPDPEQPPRRDGAVEEEIQREGAFRRTFEEPRREDGGAGIDERRDRALGAARHAPVLVEREIAAAGIADGMDASRRGAGCASMRSASQPPASQRRLGRTPSSQKESELRSRNGASPRSGSARFTPPPVSSSASRSSEITIFGARRAFRCASRTSAR